jgi:hypothetical protein
MGEDGAYSSYLVSNNPIFSFACCPRLVGARSFVFVGGLIRNSDFNHFASGSEGSDNRSLNSGPANSQAAQYSGGGSK